MNQIDVALLAIAATLFSVFAIHRLTMWRSRRDVVRSSVLTFKSTFTDEIACIRNGNASFGTFTDAFQKHKIAVDTVMPILPFCYQRKLQKAWDEYCGKGSDIDTATFITGSSCHPNLYPEFKNRFCALHDSLNDLL